MKFIRGKRTIQQEHMYGIVKVNEYRVGINAILLVIGRRGWGVQWRKKSKS